MPHALDVIWKQLIDTARSTHKRSLRHSLLVQGVPDLPDWLGRQFLRLQHSEVLLVHGVCLVVKPCACNHCQSTVKI